MERFDGRKNDELRPVDINIDYLEHPHGSCLFQMGKTKVICAASIQDGVPTFLKNQGTGWLTAEYEMLPHAAQERGIREATQGRRKGRSHEIQRIIGRVLRAVVELEKLGERTIWIDCDVIQADGGTRTASITGGFIALYQAFKKLVKKGEYQELPINNFVAAVSVGVVNNQILLDLAYEEDSIASVDMNLAMTEEGRIVEIQGTSESVPYDKDKLSDLVEIGYKGISELIKKQKSALGLD